MEAFYTLADLPPRSTSARMQLQVSSVFTVDPYSKRLIGWGYGPYPSHSIGWNVLVRHSI